MSNNRLIATITRKVQNTPDVVTLYFTVGGKVLQHRAGQYITVFFDDTDIREGKAYSLSSAPHDRESSITVKNIGLFSGKLHALRPGSVLAISVPYGSFNAYSESPIVAIAAGVGIAPIWSIIRDECARKTGRGIRLLYSNKTADDIVFREDIDVLDRDNPAFSLQHFSTRTLRPGALNRRIDVAKDAAQYANDHCFYLCGSAEFVRAMWRQLAEAGVPEAAISTETFFEVPIWKA